MWGRTREGLGNAAAVQESLREAVLFKAKRIREGVSGFHQTLLQKYSSVCVALQKASLVRVPHDDECHDHGASVCLPSWSPQRWLGARSALRGLSDTKHNV